MSDWIHHPHDSALIGKRILEKDRYNNNFVGAIRKWESENDVVWITLQACQFNWKNANIPKVKGYGIDTMSIFYNNPNHKEKLLKLDTMQDIEKTTTHVRIFMMLPSIFGPIF